MLQYLPMNRFEGYIFVGENRSPSAINHDWSWENCQTNTPHLCAKKLFSALETCGINPKKQIFINLWHDDGRINIPALTMLEEISQKNYPIVGMGKKVQTKLQESNIPHKELVHPAARGIWANPQTYQGHVNETFG